MIKLITHDRVAHADDAIAAAILRIVFGEEDVKVLRTRNPGILRDEAGQPNVFLLDIGGQYDPARRLFDHHQPEGAGYRDELNKEWPYATAGLVWLHYGADAVRKLHPTLSAADVADVTAYIDEAVMRHIDAVDCGVWQKHAGPSLSSILASFNPPWFQEEHDPFELMMDLSQVILCNFINRFAGKLLARDTVRNAQHVCNGKILLLEKCIPWVNIVADEFPEVFFAVYPVSAGEHETQWQLRCAVDTSMRPRIQLPADWGGLEREMLSLVNGVPGAVFCHRSRHLAGAMTKEAALAMAERALGVQVNAPQLLAA